MLCIHIRKAKGNIPSLYICYHMPVRGSNHAAQSNTYTFSCPVHAVKTMQSFPKHQCRYLQLMSFTTGIMPMLVYKQVNELFHFYILMVISNQFSKQVNTLVSDVFKNLDQTYFYIYKYKKIPLLVLRFLQVISSLYEVPAQVHCQNM